jgi:hypothetical protein
MNLARSEHRFDSHTAPGILTQQIVEDRVADLICHLVGVSLGDRLRGEQAP